MSALKTQLSNSYTMQFDLPSEIDSQSFWTFDKYCLDILYDPHAYFGASYPEELCWPRAPQSPDSPRLPQTEPTILRALVPEKERKTLPVKSLITRIKKLSVENIYGLIRGPDVPQYTYAEQSLIFSAISERFKTEPDKDDGNTPHFSCHICPKAFENANQLKRHSYTHGPRNYRCNVKGCTWSFIFSRDLKRHKERHGIAVEVFKCGFTGCGRLLGRRDNARNHIRTVHGVKWGEADALVEAVQTDTDAPGEAVDPAEEDQILKSSASQSKDQSITDSVSIGAQAASEFDTTRGKAQAGGDTSSQATATKDSSDSNSEGSGSDWSSGGEATPSHKIAVQQQPQLRAGVVRSRSTRSKERVKRSFYTATRPKPSRQQNPRLFRRKEDGPPSEPARIPVSLPDSVDGTISESNIFSTKPLRRNPARSSKISEQQSIKALPSPPVNILEEKTLPTACGTSRRSSISSQVKSTLPPNQPEFAESQSPNTLSRPRLRLPAHPTSEARLHQSFQTKLQIQ